MNFAQVLRRSARQRPDGIVLLHGQRRIDYLGLEMAAKRIATVLLTHHGIDPGDRVAVLLPGTPEFAFAAYGILWAGATLVALDPDTEPAALGDAITLADARLVIGWHAVAEAIEQVSLALDLDWLLVEPGEFSRLLAAIPPHAPLADLTGEAPAILGGPAPGLVLGHAELAERVFTAVHQMSLAPGDVIAGPPSLADPVHQIWTLHAAIAAGAAVRLAPDPAGVEHPVTLVLHEPGRFDRVVPSMVELAGDEARRG